jgi:hypothetical protein
MSLSCLNAICCDDELTACFTQVCGDQAKFDSSIAAVAIVENDTFPEIGDTITLSTTGATVLTACNYIESLLQWVRDKQFACEGGGKYYHLFHNGFLAKATRAKPTTKLSENGSNYFAKKYLGYDTTAELMLEEHYLPNTDVICAIQKRAASLSVIYFFKQGGFVLDSDKDFNLSIQEAGFEITGNKNEYVMGSITLAESGDCQPSPYYASDPKKFIQELKKKTEFTFGANTVTGLTEIACGSRGTCKAYEIAPDTAFTLTPLVNELVSCGNFDLFQNCNDELPVALPIVINSITGEVEAATGLPVGEYKFIVKVSNDCCIQGSTCFTVSVK